MKALIALALLLTTSAAQASSFKNFECFFDEEVNGEFNSFPMKFRPWADGSAGYLYRRPGTGIMVMATQWSWQLGAIELSITLKDQSVHAHAYIRENGYVDPLMLTKEGASRESYSVRCKGIE